MTCLLHWEKWRAAPSQVYIQSPSENTDHTRTKARRPQTKEI